MAVQTSTSRVFTCDVPDCPSRVVIKSNASAEPLPEGTLPKGWHSHEMKLKAHDTPPELHCDKHWYRWHPAGDFIVVPRIKRGRKGVAEGEQASTATTTRRRSRRAEAGGVE